MSRMLPGFDPQLLFPDGGLEAGLFFTSDRRVHGRHPSFPAARVIECRDYERVKYGEPPEPEQADYFWCEICQEHHLRECFDGSPPVIGVEPWRLCHVELAERLGYRRIALPRPEPPFKDNMYEFPEIEYKNRGRLIWVIDGWFLAHHGHIIGLEQFSMGRIRMTYDSTLRLTPRIGVF